MLSGTTVLERDEAERLKALLQYEILDTLPDPALDEITGLAAALTGAPLAFIGFVDWSRVWYKSRVGFANKQQPRTSSACQFVVLQAAPLHITDATQDARFVASGIPLAPGLYCRSYAAAPLVSPSGAVLGTLAVASPQAEAFRREHLDTLVILARQVVTRLELYAKGSAQERVLRSRQRVERSLTVERNFVSAVLDTISALVLVMDTAGRIVRFNRASEVISGYSFVELVGRSFPEELFLPEQRESAMRMFERARAGHPQDTCEIEWRSKSGRARRIAWTATSIRDAQGKISFVISTGVDVTEQREAEQALRASEARYRQLVENSLGMVCTHDLAGVLLSINTHAAASLGYTPEELIGTPLRDYIAPGHLAAWDSYFASIGEQEEHQGRLHLQTRDGRLLVIAYRNRLLRLPGADPFVLSHGIDMTEQIHAEEELHALMRQHESILDSVGDGIWGMDMQGRLTFLNRSAAAMFGYTPEEMLGRDAHAMVHHSRADGTPYPAEECPILSSLNSAEPMHVDDDVFWRKDGSSFPVEYVACPLIHGSLVQDSLAQDSLAHGARTEGGRTEGIVVAFKDVTERRRLDRMKDEFISTVSHELRTPLTSLRAALGLISGGALEKRPEKVPKMLDIAIGNCDRLVRLVNDIVDFETLGRERMPLHPSEWSALDLLLRATELEQPNATRAGVTFRIDAHQLNVWVDGDRIVQTLHQLLSNALKFSPRGAEVRVAVRASSENEATFEVQDYGPGIPAEKMELIFDRFQQADASDSRVMGGAGLGLALCRAIVQQHGGRIWAESHPGQGSTFFFTVPRQQPV